MTDAAPRAMSAEEYRRTERDSPFKREYVGGFVYPLHAQAGASGKHVRISGNVFGSLYPTAIAQGCRLYQSDMQVHLANADSYFYPDVMLVCGQDQPDEYYETSPCLLVEVLSGSTASYDRRDKFTAYTSISTLQTYLIVSQTERYVIEYQRGAEGWVMREHRQSGEVGMPCLGRTLSLDDIYRTIL